jgi:3-hydroxyisobutyrate dehydrogenase-like beta-hydroxyacid dehydrogenase
MNRVALFHPGEMGAAVGACLKRQGARVLCALNGRSKDTLERARKAGLEDAGSLQAALEQSEAVLSVCPPHGALALAREVAACGFRGIYVDANAISPETARAVGAAVEAAGASFVDAGIIGAPPVDRPASLVLCGARANDIARLFGETMNCTVLEGPLGSASATKACYAAWTKGTWLALASIYAAAEQLGVAQALREQWARSHPQLLEQLGAPSLSPAKAWRWIAEMEEIAATFESAGQPGGFALAAAEICRRLEHFKDERSRPSIETISPVLQRQRGRPVG